MKNLDESRNRKEDLTNEQADVLPFRPAEQESGSISLLPRAEGDAMRARWKEIQTAFVDDPKSAVENADTLVADAMEHIVKTFSEKRSKLEDQWSRGNQASTEDLRQALQRYRAFFDRLLSM